MIPCFPSVPVLGISVLFILTSVTLPSDERRSTNVLPSKSITEWQALNEFGPHVGSSIFPLDAGHWQDVWLLVGMTQSTPIHCLLYSWKFIIPVFHSRYPQTIPWAVLLVLVAAVGVEQENQGATSVLEPTSAKYQQLFRVLILTSLSSSSHR